MTRTMNNFISDFIIQPSITANISLTFICKRLESVPNYLMSVIQSKYMFKECFSSQNGVHMEHRYEKPTKVNENLYIDSIALA